MSHTPGPWTISPYSSIVGIAVSGGGIVIAGVRGGKERSEADARLIAAAPDLLELALQYADECASCGGTGANWTNPTDPQEAKEVACPDCADIRAVIDKAEGRA